MTTATATLDRSVDGQPFPAVGTYEIDAAHSQVQGIVRHLKVSKVRANFTDFAGTITVAEEPTRSGVQIAIAASTVDTRNADRDAHLRSGDFLDVEQFPEITFRSTSVEPGWRVTGDLTIAGVTRSVVLDTEYLGTHKSPMGPTIAAFEATTTINREDFGITWNAPMEAGGVLVSKEVKIELEIQAALQGQE
ncbi:YceI family protein [Euzebya tangerina]|uniref:YceI family protein n=1 Tax=Euzebya tangerina TaxID=591198 RepID=UPI000E324121|nr:YceI family protein [Euzebya tangerina]